MGQKISEKQMKEEIRSVVRENIKEVTTNDWHYKAIMSIWDKGGSFTRKKIAAVLCGDPKADRRDVEDALRNSGYDEVTDVTDRLRIEGVITEKQFKGLDGIAPNISLKKVSKDQKLKIIKAPGNIIDFIVPKGEKRNFWQVMGTGKIKKNTDGQYYLEGKVINSPMFKSADDLINGVDWDSMEERRRFNEGVIKEEDSIPGGLAKGMTLNDIAEKHGMGVDMLVAEFKKGIQTEMEHTTDREMAKEITMDHLFEDPQYYTKLATVEEYVDDKGVEHVAAALPQTEEEPIKEGEDSEETLEGLKEMAMGDLERIADYANMILERMGQGQNLDSWMYSQITLAVDQLNSVHDTMDGTDGKKEEVKEGKINELTSKEKRIKDGNPDNVFYIFYKGQFDIVYWAMNPSDLFNIYWDEFKVRRPSGSQFKLNPEFIIVSKKEYDKNTSNHYAKLKPYVDKFWDKLQNESVNENLDNYSKDAITDMIINLSRYEGNEKLIADLKKILKQRSLGKLKKEQSVNEASESNIISQIKDIAKKHQNNIVIDPKSGKKMRVDAFSASAIATVYDALSDSNKEKFLASGLLGMQQMAMKLLKK